MNVIKFIQDSLSNPWVILGLSLLVLFLGWILSRLVAAWSVRLLNRTPLIRRIGRLLKIGDLELFNRRLQQIIRVLVFLLSLWISWKILISNQQIHGLLLQAWQLVVEFVRLPVVIFILDLVLIGLATLLLVKVFGWVRTGFALLSKRILAERGKHIKTLKFQRVQLLTESQLINLLLIITRYARYVVNILLIIIYLGGVFSVFPQTRIIVTGILDSIFGAVQNVWQSFVNYLPSLLNLILIIVVTYFGLKLIRFIFNEIEKGTISFSGFYPEWATPTYQLVRALIIALALVAAFPFLPGSSSPAFQGVSVFVGLLLSIGSASVVGNIISGVVLTYTRAFQLGDRVKIADTVGDVVEKGLLVTRVRTIKNVIISIPNGLVLGSHIVNYSAIAREQGLILNTTVTIGYDTPWRLMHETLIKAAQKTEGILGEPRPFVLQTSLDDFYVSYELNAYTDQPLKMATIYSALHQNIQDCCNEAGIEIMSPHYTSLRDGNATTIPADNLPGDYKAPPFEVNLRNGKKE